MDNQTEKLLICHACLQENEVRADFCSKCGAPIGSYVTVDPLKRIYAMGWVNRALVSRAVPRYALTAISISVSSSIFFVVYISFSRESDTSALIWVRNALLLAFSFVNLAFLYRIWANYLAHRRKQK